MKSQQVISHSCASKTNLWKNHLVKAYVLEVNPPAKFCIIKFSNSNWKKIASRLLKKNPYKNTAISVATKGLCVHKVCDKKPARVQGNFSFVLATL